VVVRAPTVPGQLVLTCPPSRALALSAERSKHTATTSHREGRCSPCRSSSLLGSLASRQAPSEILASSQAFLETLAHRQALLPGSMAHCHASCDIAIMVSASTAARCACQATDTMVTLPVCMGCRWSSDTASQIGDVVVAEAARLAAARTSGCCSYETSYHLVLLHLVILENLREKSLKTFGRALALIAVNVLLC
jgi:hypothetical protein